MAFINTDSMVTALVLVLVSSLSIICHTAFGHFSSSKIWLSGLRIAIGGWVLAFLLVASALIYLIGEFYK